MGESQRAWRKLYENGSRKYFFCIILPFLGSFEVRNISHVARKSFIKTLIHFGSIEIIMAYLGPFELI